MGNGKSKADVVECMSDNDCYKHPDYPYPQEENKDGVVTKEAEVKTVCCAVFKTVKYDTGATNY